MKNMFRKALSLLLAFVLFFTAVRSDVCAASAAEGTEISQNSGSLIGKWVAFNLEHDEWNIASIGDFYEFFPDGTFMADTSSDYSGKWELGSGDIIRFDKEMDFYGGSQDYISFRLYSEGGCDYLCLYDEGDEYITYEGSYT
jgi:hypothetical protein